MRGKAGLIIGIGIGYVLGSRAGRERYEQIKRGAQRVWNLDPVQRQVNAAKGFGKRAALAVPGAMWDGAVKLTKAAANANGAKETLTSTLNAAAESANDVTEAVAEAAEEGAKASRTPAKTRPSSTSSKAGAAKKKTTASKTSSAKGKK